MFSFFTKTRETQGGQRVCLDWAAATPLLPAAYEAMQPFLAQSFANPSAIHREGQVARDAVETARGQVATALQVRPEFITWTGSGTEANNIAILGVVEQLRQSGRAYTDMQIISTAIEHPSVTQTLAHLATLGVNIVTVPVKESGVIDLQALRELVTDQTVLLTTHYINSEIGTIQPTRAISKILKELSPDARLHVDAAQAPLWLNCQFSSTGADVLTLDAGKCCGPKGVGVLVHQRGIELAPSMHGGGQESGLRPGTENVAGIVGAAVAIAWAQASWRVRADAVRAVRNQSVEHLLQELPQAILNGADPTSDDRVANNINISIPGLDTEFAAVVLDKHGYAVSTKSACSGAGGGASAVVLATTGDEARASSTLRVTLRPQTSFAEIKRLTDVLKEHGDQMQHLT